MSDATLPSGTALSPGTARILTDEVKRDAESLWRKLVELYEGGAHIALKYGSWGDYFQAEFGGSRSRAYQLLSAGRVLESVQQVGLPAPSNDRQAAELAPLLDEPEALRDAWAEVVHLHPKPTAKQVREVVERHLPAPRMATERDQHATLVRVWDSACGVLDDSAENAAAKIAHLVQFDGAGPITADRLERVSAFTSAAAALLRKGV